MQTTIQYIRKELDGLYPKTEIDGFIRLILETVCNLTYTQIILNRDQRISKEEFSQIDQIVLRLKNFEPIQYVLGETEFYDLTLKVNSSVLIPRPETEELVDWIVKENEEINFSILDIGTGSACIALALKQHFKKAEVLAVDVSAKALKVAFENAKRNNLDVSFSKVNILKWEDYQWNLFDIIVSNPPYVRELEKQQMETNVLKYEPENALFVPDQNPLLYYIRIAEFALKFLRKDGWLYFEINEALGAEMIHMLKEKGFQNIELKKDLVGKDRMIRCCKK